MDRFRVKQLVGLSIIILFATNSVFLFASEGKAVEPFFTLVFKTNSGGIRPDYGNFLKQQLARIGIKVDVIIQDWPTFVGELIAYRDFDICYVALVGDGVEPDLTGVYYENGSLNLFGYHTSMDYNETLGTGLNEWYMKEGAKMLPAYSQEKVEHYWAWQQHLMDNILPCLPTFTPKVYTAHWANLQGYNVSDGLLQSWGKMSWDGSHQGQENSNEIVITDAAWTDLFPFFQDSPANIITSALMDTMIYYDTDMTPWPHLATNWTHITDTQVRVKLREGIKWQNDPDGNFTNEYFNAEDVYFTYTLCNRRPYIYDPWFDYMEIVDDYTIDFFIDGDSSVPEAQSSSLYLPSFEREILPEHYLNQTQLADGSPDFTHSSWSTFATNCFGTGLFSLTHFEEGEETILTVNPECWRLNTSITSDPALDWERRFGDFTNGLNQLRIRISPNQLIALSEFEGGKTDIEGITQFPETTREEMIASPDFIVQNDIRFQFGFFGYNMRSVRPVIGNPAVAPRDASITVGLAIRKAISYAIDLEEMNDIIHGGEYAIIYHPISTKLGIWCNPNIIKYKHNLTKAELYMVSAGAINDPYTPEDSGINWFYSLSGLFILLGIVIIIRKKK